MNMCGIRQAAHVKLPVEEGNGKPPPLLRTSQVYDGASEMTIPSRTCLMAENSSSSSYLAIFLLLLPLSGNGTHSFSDIPHDSPSNLNATISFLTNSDSTGSILLYTANGKYLSACLNLTLFHLVTIITPYHCNSLSYSLRSPVSCTSCTFSILSRRVSIITIVPYLFSDLSILPITFHCYTNPTVSHHHLRKYRKSFS